MKTNEEIVAMIETELRGIRDLTTAIWGRYDLVTSKDDLVMGNPTDHMEAINHLDCARKGLVEAKKCFLKQGEK